MGRLLDEDMVINALQTTKFRNDLFTDNGYKRAISIIKELPPIQPEKAQLSKEGATSDFPEPTRIITETRAIPSDDDRVSLSERVTATFYDDEYDEWSQKTVTVRDVLDAVCDEYTVLPPAQPEPTDINAKEAVYNLAEKIGIHQLFALTVELRGEPIQPEPQEGHWIEGKIYRDVIECNCSECGQLMTTAATVRMNYCPRCGARMKEGEPNG